MKLRLVLSATVVICVVVLVTYHPALGINYYFFEDYTYLLMTYGMSWGQAVMQFFDPRLQWIWYRPIQGLVLWILNSPLGANAILYHFWNILIHLLNAVLLWILVWRVTGNIRMGVVSAIIFGTLFFYSFAVFWPVDSAPLAAFFSLLAAAFWIDYLKQQRWRNFALALTSYTLALLTKETSATLIASLFLIDRLVVSKESSIADLFRRYISFGIILASYLGIEYSFQPRGEIHIMGGYFFDIRVFRNLLAYLAALLPWPFDHPQILGALAIVLPFLIAVWLTHSRKLIFLGLITVLMLMPVLPLQGTDLRQLYLPAITISVLFAGLIEAGRGTSDRRRWYALLAGGLIAVLVVGGSWQVGQSAGTLARLAREQRVPIRDFAQRHPLLAPKTLVYFVDPPIPDIYLAGMSYLRFRDRVIVSSSEIDRPANFRDHPLAYVVYYDESGRQREHKVIPNIPMNSVPVLPAKFEVPMQVVGFEMPDWRFRRGQAIVLLLYWQATERIDRDYTIYAHLIDSSGMMVGGFDSQPKGGQLPTTRWAPGQFVVHPVVIPVSEELVPGSDYAIAIGVYFYPTMERISLATQPGVPSTIDQVLLGPITIE